jgi:hypothetical protein
MYSRNINAEICRMSINHSRVSEVFAKNKVGIKEIFVELREGVWLMSPNPLGSGQGAARIGKTRRPVQRQSSFPGLTLQIGVHQPIA